MRTPVPSAKPIEKIVLALATAVVLLLVGIWWGGHPGDLPPALREAFVAGANGTSVDQALTDIEHDYFRRLGVAQVENHAIGGAIAGLHDPYALYQTPAQFRDFAKAPSPTRFGGIGVSVVPVVRGLLVKSLLRGSPAARAGIKPGDLIVSGDGRSFAGKPSSYSTGVIRGATGTSLTLTFARGAHERTVSLRRIAITEPPPPIVSGHLVVFDHVKIAVIALETFEVTGVHAQVATALRRLLTRGARAVILDLRDNGGGLVTEAQLVASLFIRRGVIVTTRGRAQPTETLRATGRPLATSQPMVVLVNGYTASAAEIVAGALQADRRARIVGTHTYGKGVYQEVRALPNRGAIDITVGEYYLPNGRNLGGGGLRRGSGLQPNVLVRAPVTARTDPALMAALRLLAASLR